MRKLAYLLCLLVLTLNAVHAQEEPATPETSKKAKGVAWQANYQATLKAAKKAKRPIMVAFILKGEDSCESIVGEHFADAAIIKMSQKFDCLLAFASFESKDADSATDNSDAMLEALKDRVTLAQLQKIEKNARGDLMDSNLVSTPQFVFLKPDGESILLRHVWMLTPKALLKKMQMAYHFFDETWPLPKEVQQENEIEKSNIAALLTQCESNNMTTRREAIQKLAIKDQPEVIEFLIKQTHKDVKQQRRLEAIRAMGQDGQAKYLPTLHRLLVRESTFQIRSNVSNAIKSVGLIESASHLSKAVKKEKKDNVRSLLMRALAKCAGKKGPALSQALGKLLKSSSNIDRITALYIIAEMTHDPILDAAIVKAARNRSAQVRTAAFYAIGSLKIEKGLKTLKKQLSSEKQIGLNACKWALKALGEPIKGEPKNPQNDVSVWLPSAAY